MFRLVSLIILLMLLRPAAAQEEVYEVLRLGRGTANALAWRPDGEVLAVGSGTGVWLYDEQFNTLGHLENQLPINSKLVWNSDGTLLAAVGGGSNWQIGPGSLQIWRVDQQAAQGELLWQDTHSNITDISWHPQQQWLAAAYSENIVRIWDIASGRLIQEIADAGHRVDWNSDGVRLAVGITNQSVKIIHAETKEVIRIIVDEGANGQVTWSPDGSLLATDCNHSDFVEFGGTCIWDAASGGLVHARGLAKPVWSPDGTMIIYYGYSPVAGYGGHWISVWELPFDEPLVRREGYSGLYDVTFHPTRRLLTGVESGSRFIEVDLTTESFTVIDRATPLHRMFASPIAWSPSQNQIASYANHDILSMVAVWDIDPVENHFIDQPSILLDSTTACCSLWLGLYQLDWSDENTMLIHAAGETNDGASYEVEQWRVSDQEKRGVLIDAPYQCRPVINDDYSRYACTNANEQVIEVYAASRELLFTVPMPNPGVEIIGWSPDNTRLILAYYDAQANAALIEFWELEPWRKIITYRSINTSYKEFVIWSPDGRYFALRGFDQNDQFGLVIMDNNTYAQIGFLALNSSFAQFSWHPERYILSLWNETAETLFWDIQQDQIIGRISIPSPYGQYWSPDGSLIAIPPADGTIRIWDVSAFSAAR